jgi:DNA-binding protein
MQVVEHVKVVKNELLDEIYAPDISEKSEKVKQQEANIQRLFRAKSLNRFLEASCDCV